MLWPLKAWQLFRQAVAVNGQLGTETGKTRSRNVFCLQGDGTNKQVVGYILVVAHRHASCLCPSCVQMESSCYSVY